VINEYIEPAIVSGLNDFSPYVRKVAVIGCSKLYNYSSTHFLDNTDLTEELLKMCLYDSSADVVSNCLNVSMFSILNPPQQRFLMKF
jgi:vesicle coat complex subunit